jgi:small GTP-binding protein
LCFLRIRISQYFSIQHSYLGKTTVLYSVKSDKSIPITPTISSNFENIVINNTSISVIEEGGRSAFRPLRRVYYRHVAGIIFVIDSNDRERIDQVRDELHQMFNDEHLQHKPFLILANKQDLPNRMNVDELRDKLNLNKLDGNTKWHLQPTSAIHNEGIYEGFKWLEDSLVEKIDPMKPIVETLNDVKTMKNYLTSIFNMDNFKTLLNKSI